MSVTPSMTSELPEPPGACRENALVGPSAFNSSAAGTNPERQARCPRYGAGLGNVGEWIRAETYPVTRSTDRHARPA